MKKALVYYLYGNRNAGDMAICMGTIEFLQRHGYVVTMVSRFSEAEEEYQRSKDYVAEYYPDVTVYPGPFSFERDFSALKKLTAYATSVLKVAGIKADTMTRKLISEHDVVFFNGGNLLRGASITDYARLVALFYPIRIAFNMGKPVFCLPQSTAGISELGEKQLKKYMGFFKEIYVREKISYKELTKRFPEYVFVESTDMAFHCKDTETAKKKYSDLRLKLTGKDIAVVVRNTGIGDIGTLSKKKQECLLSELDSFILNHGDFHYWIVIQTVKDREFSNYVFNRYEEKADLIECNDPMLLREIYKNMDMLVSMRLHAAILSLSALTPVMGIFSEEWGLKNPGIMEDYHMPFTIVEENGNVPLIEIGDEKKEGIAKDIHTYSQSIENLFHNI